MPYCYYCDEPITTEVRERTGGFCGVECEGLYNEPEPDGDYYDDDYDGDHDQEEFVSVDPSVLGPLSFTPRTFSPQRGAMMTSVELEFAKNPGPLALELHRKGLSPVSTVGSYHENARGGMGGAAYVEYDGSVDNGGELVISFLDLPETRANDRLWHTLDVLRGHVASGTNKLDTRCGCHIHVDALGRPLGEIVSSTAAYIFLEDILYRIAAANYKAHRSTTGNSYTGLTPKHFNKSNFSQQLYERYLGMNVSNYLQYRSQCTCGAGYDGADNCACPNSRFHKPTIEFRLWNTTANPVKLHAFIALSQAIIHYGVGRDISPEDLGDPLDFMERGIAPDIERAYASRIVWMFQSLPLSREERDSIRYCLRNCDIGQYLEGAASNGLIESELVQGILYDDDMLEIPEYVTPERIPTPAPPPEPIVHRMPRFSRYYEYVRMMRINDDCRPRRAVSPYIQVGLREYWIGPRGGIMDQRGQYCADPVNGPFPANITLYQMEDVREFCRQQRNSHDDRMLERTGPRYTNPEFTYNPIF